jgi:Uncharacterised protein family (UPF0193)
LASSTNTKSRQKWTPRLTASLNVCAGLIDKLIEHLLSTLLIAVLSEIYERADWLAEMEELGEGKKHRNVIHLQIASRLREIERLEKAKAVSAEQ